MKDLKFIKYILKDICLFLFCKFLLFFQAIEVSGIVILQYSGSLHFANRESFKSSVIRSSGMDSNDILRCIKDAKKRQEEIKKNNNLPEESHSNFMSRMKNGVREYSN